MKNLLFAALIAVTMCVSVRSQTVESDKDALHMLNRRVNEAVKEGRLDDALDAARRAVELAKKISGEKSEDAAIAFYNLGEVYIAKKNYEEAVPTLHAALDFFESAENKFGKMIAKTAQSLGIAYGYAKNHTSAEKYLIKAVAFAEKFYANEKKEVIPYLVNLRNFYIYIGDFNKADERFTYDYTFAAKLFNPESPELETIEDAHYCFATRFFSENMAERRIKRFRELIKEVQKTDTKPSFDLFASSSETEEEDDDGNVVNSKGIKLARPSYPSQARWDGARGLIPVKITIDVTGKVIEAKTFCGHAALRKVCEKAALKSRFTPTLVEGKPVQVTGYIIYNFVLK